MRLILKQLVTKRNVDQLVDDDNTKFYKRHASQQRHTITPKLDVQCWTIITDILFNNHLKVLFAIVYQILKDKEYDCRFLPLLTAPSLINQTTILAARYHLSAISNVQIKIRMRGNVEEVRDYNAYREVKCTDTVGPLMVAGVIQKMRADEAWILNFYPLTYITYSLYYSHSSIICSRISYNAAHVISSKHYLYIQ